MKNFTVLLTLASVCFMSTLQAKSSLIVVSNLEKMVAIKAVDDVEIAKGLDRLGRTFLPSLESKLQGTREYQLVDRNNFSALLKEIDFNDSGLVGDQVAKKFKLKGAGFIMLVKFLDVEYVANKRAFELTGTTEESISLDASVSVKILNTSTATVEQALPVIEVSLTQYNNQVRSGDQVASHKIWSKAGSQLATKVVEALAASGSPAKVLAVNGNQVLVNKGSNSGFKKGLQVRFYAMKKVTDDETGEVFVNEVPIGRGKVLRGDVRKCFIEVSEDLGIAKGCLVRGD